MITIFCRKSNFEIYWIDFNFNFMLFFYGISRKLTITIITILHISFSYFELANLLRSGITLCLSLFASNISDRITRKYILLILRSVLKFPSLAYDLFHRHNFHSWIALTIQVSLSGFISLFSLHEKYKFGKMNQMNSM